MTRRRFAVGCAGVLLVVVLLALIPVWVFSQPEKALPIPGRIAGYPLRGHVFGPEAAEEIRNMHRGTFPMTGAAIAIYGNMDAVLWVSETWGSIGAYLLERGMTRAIAKGDTPFEPLGTRQVRGVTVYELTGMGQMHYYFRVGDMVYWLAVNEEKAEEALDEVVAFALGVEQGLPQGSARHMPRSILPFAAV